MNGEFNATTLAAAINLVYALKTKQISVVGLNTNARLEPLEMAEFVARHPQIRRSISLAKNLSSLAPPSMIGAAHFVASELDLIQADAFLESLNTGQNLEAGNPILLLRERFIQNKGTIAKLHTNYLFALTIKAWNAYHAGTQIKNLRLRTDGPNPEPFPTPI